MYSGAMDIILNNIALWRPKRTDDLSVIKQPKNTRIYDPETKLYKLADKPIYRYAKNYTVGKKTPIWFCLFARTYSDDAKIVEDALDNVAKTVTVAQAKAANLNPDYADFEYLNKLIEEK